MHVPVNLRVTYKVCNSTFYSLSFLKADILQLRRWYSDWARGWTTKKFRVQYTENSKTFRRLNYFIILQHSGSFIFQPFYVTLKSVQSIQNMCCMWDRDSAVSTATRYKLISPGNRIPAGGMCENFCNNPYCPRGQPSLLYHGYRDSFTGVKQLAHGVHHPPPSSAEVKEKVQL